MLNQQQLVYLLDDVHKNCCHSRGASQPHLKQALVVDGKAVTVIMKRPEVKAKFCAIAQVCNTVIACRYCYCNTESN